MEQNKKMYSSAFLFLNGENLFSCRCHVCPISSLNGFLKDGYLFVTEMTAETEPLQLW